MVELALVLMISGFTMLMVARATKVYTVGAQNDLTLTNLKMSKDALKEFAALNGFYPCPADPSLNPGDALYGVSQCRDYFTDPTILENCADDPPGSLVCINSLSRDGNSDTFPDVIIQGILPFRTLTEGQIVSNIGTFSATPVQSTPFAETHKLDGFGTMLSYAVTEHMTNYSRHSLSNKISPHTGGIFVRDENLIDVTIPPGSAHYVLFSTGDNAVGGYSKAGVLIENCFVNSVSGLPDPAPAPGNPTVGGGIKLDRENCDQNDAIFMQAIRSLSDDENYYDDTLVYTSIGLTPLWESNVASPVGENYIYNTNSGEVGVGTNTPIEQLHVVGNLSAQTMAIAKEYCNEAGDDCFDPNAIAGDITDMECPDTVAGETQVITGISENKVICDTIDWTLPNKSCPTTTTAPAMGVTPMPFMRGFSNKGNILCCDTLGNCQEF